MTECISLGDRGLDLVLGGGLRLVRRVGDKCGLVALIRGPAGAGKTLFGLHAALAVAAHMKRSVAYACVELLPTELEAQLRSQRADHADVVVAHGENPSPPQVDPARRIDARLLDLSHGVASFGPELERFWDSLTSSALAPSVLVVDSLSEGYGLGAAAPREFVDAVCKLAAHWGVALILLEESATDAASPWVFAADTVLELSALTDDVESIRASPFERRVVVAKHRFGPSDVGPHRFSLRPGEPVRVYPRPSAWLEPWAESVDVGLKPRDLGEMGLGVRALLPKEHPRAQEFPDAAVVTLFGPDQGTLRERARVLLSQPGEPLKLLEVNLQGRVQEHAVWSGAKGTMTLASPYVSAHRLLRLLLDGATAQPSTECVVVRDLRSLRDFWDRAGVRRTLSVFCQLMRRRGVAVIMVETTPSAMSMVASAGGLVEYAEPGIEPPSSVDWADVSLEVRRDASKRRWTTVLCDHRDGVSVADPP